MAERAGRGDAAFTEHRGLLTAVAYRLLGSVTDADDVVQDALAAPVGRRTRGRRRPARVPRPGPHAVGVLTRLVVDRLRRAAPGTLTGVRAVAA